MNVWTFGPILKEFVTHVFAFWKRRKRFRLDQHISEGERIRAGAPSGNASEILAYCGHAQSWIKEAGELVKRDFPNNYTDFEGAATSLPGFQVMQQLNVHFDRILDLLRNLRRSLD